MLWCIHDLYECWFYGVCPKGLVNFYGNTRLGNLKRDHRLFLHFRHTGPPIILNVEHGVTGYFDIGFKRGQRLF